MEQALSTRCPLCAGAEGCDLCIGTGFVAWSRIEPLATAMERVANAIQVGDEDRAAAETRRACRLARSLVP